MRKEIPLVAGLVLLMLGCTGTPDSFSVTVGSPSKATEQKQENVPAKGPAPGQAENKNATVSSTEPIIKDGVVIFYQGGPLAAGIQPPQDTYLKEGEVLVPNYAPDLFEGNWGIGKIITPASPKTKGEAEVLLYYRDRKFWISNNLIIHRSRPAVPEELKPGMLVLCGKIDDAHRRQLDEWFLGVIKNTDTLYKGEVELENYREHFGPKVFQYKVANIRIIEEPILRFKYEKDIAWVRYKLP
jgi:hypothetical protein